MLFEFKGGWKKMKMKKFERRKRAKGKGSSAGIVPVPWTSEAITLCPALYFKEFAKVVKL